MSGGNDNQHDGDKMGTDVGLMGFGAGKGSGQLSIGEWSERDSHDSLEIASDKVITKGTGENERGSSSTELVAAGEMVEEGHGDEGLEREIRRSARARKLIESLFTVE
ncbi:hypothetical protein GLOTRDRAFT_130334 [Gloeophyllum trabeum ATCC 11539]|uniref:Uncharacterized protein n=1 Tax=Gloeophyllum trabeum (strain ATCC 11539 / FP-39264 / Madison 617) TaxID=670483 RepID=S7Q1S2_GLOTA|nr:uncharacterized protein GLOTRDRAFT_130334 [Gloeophyllum trabeum ATCC 11539]EPQ53936.1 hypothetical protein GLOTRDRAFT_130334 [Gloeophyllum trabeum ATCC 11539]